MKLVVIDQSIIHSCNYLQDNYLQVIICKINKICFVCFKIYKHTFINLYILQ